MLILKTSSRFAKVMVSTFLSIYITEEEISGEALLAIEKDDIKDIGVQPMGRRIELMAKIKEITSTQKRNTLEKWSQNWKSPHQNEKLQLWIKRIGMPNQGHCT